MNKICTDIHQSKKLIELGIDPQTTADMIYYWFGNFELNDEWYELHLGINRVDDKDIPAWSLSALMDLMPKVNGHYPELCRGKLTGEYYMWIEDTFDTQTFNNPVDAAFEIICWLKENGKL